MTDYPVPTRPAARAALCALLAPLLVAMPACANGHESRAIPNDGKDDVQALQADIDALSAKGGGTLQLDAGTYDLSRPLYLRTGVELVGRGKETVLSNVKLNQLSTWAGTTIFAGNLTTASYDDNKGMGYPGMAFTQTGSHEINVPNCDRKALARMAGEVVWFTSKQAYFGTISYAKPEFAELNFANAVNGCSIRLNDPLVAPKDMELSLHWSDGSKTALKRMEPNRAIHDTALRRVTLESAKGQAIIVTGCYRCQFTDINIGRSRRLIGMQGVRHGLYQRITGEFSERGIEVAMVATDSVIDGVDARFVDGGEKSLRPPIRFGEHARGNTLRNIRMDLGSAYVGKTRIRFDPSRDNRVENVRFIMQQLDRQPQFVYRATDRERALPMATPPGTVLSNIRDCTPDDRDCQK